MILSPAGMKVYLAFGTTDMRKSINGLSILVENNLELDLFQDICLYSVIVAVIY